jgi:diguanylate cyclase (GGDEF)-like protein/PAS domain S-box-containing protein
MATAVPNDPDTLGTEFFRVAIEASPCAMIVVDGAGALAVANREAERLFGYEPNTLVGQSVEALLPEGLRAEHSSHREQYVAQPTARPMGRRRDLLARRRDGAVIPVEVGLNPVQTPSGLFVIAAIVDLSERKRAEQRMSRHAEMLETANAELVELAATDSLTSLWNRRAFLDQLGVQLELSVRGARPLSVLILDVDHFKPYNDQFGHLAGDEVLREVARVLSDHARRSDYLARIGGEEFGVILPETNRTGAVHFAERFRSAIETSQWPRRSITISVGAATVTFPSAVPRPTSPGCSEVLSAADRALYAAKESGRNRVVHVDDMSETGRSE